MLRTLVIIVVLGSATRGNVMGWSKVDNTSGAAPAEFPGGNIVTDARSGNSHNGLCRAGGMRGSVHIGEQRNGSVNQNSDRTLSDLIVPATFACEGEVALFSYFPYRWVFTRHGGNPVLGAVPGTWQASWFTVDDVIQSNGRFSMYYSGSDTGNANTQLGLAYSDDGITWQRYSNNPIWAGAWDHFLRDVRVYQFGPSDFRLYYSDGDRHIDLAFSQDGVTWRNYEHNPILEASQDWESYVMQPRVMKISEDQWLMWYSTYGTRPRVTGLARSQDGIHWTKHEENPVLTLGKAGDWDDYSAFQPFVFQQDGYFHMIYTGSSTKNPTGYRWGYALSSDGIRWTKSPHNPIFIPDSQGSWDAGKVSCPTLVWTGPNAFNIYYAGATAPEATYLGIGLVQAQLNRIEADPNTGHQ